MTLDIKTDFEPPVPMTSPLEVYCAVGTIARAMKLGMSERKSTPFGMRDQLDGGMGDNKPKDSRITRIHATLKDFIQNEDTTDQMVRYVACEYENEK